MSQVEYRLTRAVGVMVGVSAVAVGCGPAVGAAEAPTPQTAIARAPSQPSSGSPAPSLEDAVSAIQQQQFEAALTILEQIVQDEPSNPQARYYLGVVWLNEGKTSKAIEQFERSLALDPSLTEAAVNLAAALLDSEDTERALAVIDRALASNPAEPAMLYNRALALRALGDRPAAAVAFGRAAAAAPEDESLRFSYAEALLMADKAALARPILFELVKARELEVLASTARLLGRLKEFDRCIAALNSAIERQPAAELFVNRGLCQHGSGRDDLALSDFQTATATEPDFAPGHYYLGMHWKQARDPEAARKALSRAVELAGNGPLGKAASRALNSL